MLTQTSGSTVEAWGLSLGTVAAYLALYTAYDKSSKRLQASSLLDVLLVRKGVDFTFVQMNKVISLAGITLLGVALAPRVSTTVLSCHDELLEIAGAFLAVHSCYSIYKYYGSPNIPALSTLPNLFYNMRSTIPKEYMNALRTVSVALGLSSLCCISYFAVEPSSMTEVAAITALSTSFLHFYTMEQDYKGKLAVRPFGFLGFISPVVGVVANFMSKWGFL